MDDEKLIFDVVNSTVNNPVNYDDVPVELYTDVIMENSDSPKYTDPIEQRDQ